MLFRSGYILSALSFRYIYPFFSSKPDLGWRAMFWVGIIPAMMVLWIRSGVSESPVWLERQRHLKKGKKSDSVSLIQLFRRDVIGITIQTSILMGFFIISYHSTTFWNPTRLIQSGFQPFWYMIALNAGGVVGAIMWGRAAETKLGRRGAVAMGEIGRAHV